ncbi:MAG: cytochrome c oxidase subunit II, partial [Erythrobacter sp.]|nr:cytochrome c oxidase subunit II [Erythrobacter sp.]
CSELCGPKHGFMPIAVEALPRDQFEAWVRAQPGGTVGDEALAEEDAESAQDALEAGDGAAAAEAEASTPAA